MIKFKRKSFSEYDAMRSLYVQLMKLGDRNKFPIIDSSSLIPILKGNSVVIEKFTIATKMFGKDKYRMYLKIGAKAKLPDEVRLPSIKEYDKKLGTIRLNLNGGVMSPSKVRDEIDKEEEFKRKVEGEEWDFGRDKRRSDYHKKIGWVYKQKNKSCLSEISEKLFNNNQNNNNNNNNQNKNNQNKNKGNDDGGGKAANVGFNAESNISYKVRELLGDAILYDKKSRSLVLEFNDIYDAITALNVLPFGLNYKIYLLES